MQTRQPAIFTAADLDHFERLLDAAPGYGGDPRDLLRYRPRHVGKAEYARPAEGPDFVRAWVAHKASESGWQRIKIGPWDWLCVSLACLALPGLRINFNGTRGYYVCYSEPNVAVTRGYVAEAFGVLRKGEKRERQLNIRRHKLAIHDWDGRAIEHRGDIIRAAVNAAREGLEGTTDGASALVRYETLLHRAFTVADLHEPPLVDRRAPLGTPKMEDAQ